METEKIMAPLMAEIRTNREVMLTKMKTNREGMEAKADANLKETKADMKTQIDSLLNP
jgi:hypothetical protein